MRMFDSSAMLALIFDEPGADELLPLSTRHRGKRGPKALLMAATG